MPPLVSRGTPRASVGAPYDPRFNSHKTSRRPATRPACFTALPSPWPCINLIRPGPPASNQKTCVLHHTLVFRWNDRQKFALPSGAPLASRPGMWPASQPCTACSASDRAGVRSWHWHRRYCQAGSRPRHGYAALDASLCDTPGRFVIQTAFWGSRSPGDSPGPSGLVGVPYIPGWVFWMAGDGSVWGQSGGSTAVRGPGRRSERFSGCGACGWPGMGLKASQGALGSVFDRGWLWSRLGGWQMVTE